MGAAVEVAGSKAGSGIPRAAARTTLVLAIIGASLAFLAGGLMPAGLVVCGLCALPAIIVLSSTARPPTVAPHSPTGGQGW